MPKPGRLLALALTAAIAATACAQATPPSVQPSTTPQPTDAPAQTGLPDVPTGAEDLVLQLEEGGGLMPVQWGQAEVPIFSLYGDGTVVMRDLTSDARGDETGLLRYDPLLTTRLTPDQVAALVTFAALDGGLAAARDHYDHPTVADGSTATFRLNAGGRSKVVTVYSLFPDELAPDQLARRAMFSLAERLRGFATEPGVTMRPFEPTRWRASLAEVAGQPARVNPWPWDDIAPGDFVPRADGAGAQGFPSHVLDATHVEAVGLGPLPGGLLGYAVEGSGGILYHLAIRPLLPDEER